MVQLRPNTSIERDRLLPAVLEVFPHVLGASLVPHLEDARVGLHSQRTKRRGLFFQNYTLTSTCCYGAPDLATLQPLI